MDAEKENLPATATFVKAKRRSRNSPAGDGGNCCCHCCRWITTFLALHWPSVAFGPSVNGPREDEPLGLGSYSSLPPGRRRRRYELPQATLAVGELFAEVDLSLRQALR